MTMLALALAAILLSGRRAARLRPPARRALARAGVPPPGAHHRKRRLGRRPAGASRRADAGWPTLLQRIRDRSGRPAVMTLGMVLEVPDGARIAATDCTEYHALPLDRCPLRCRARRHAVRHRRPACSLPQLHGQCHYWPPALMAAAQGDPAVRDWLTAAEPAATEDLPSPSAKPLGRCVQPAVARVAARRDPAGRRRRGCRLPGRVRQCAAGGRRHHLRLERRRRSRLGPGRSRGRHHAGPPRHLPQCRRPTRLRGCHDADG